MMHKKEQPLISICIPTYNGESFLKAALDSITKQTYRNIEVVFSDDASSDNTLGIIDKFKSQSNLPIYVFNHLPKGIAANWNHSLEKANGKYIKFLFQDDVLNPNCIEEMVKVLDSNATVALATCKREIISKESNRFTKGWIQNFKDLQVNLNFPNDDVTIIKGSGLLKSPLFKQNPINIIGEPTCVLFRKEMIKEIGFFDETMFQLVDYEYFLRMFKKYDIAFINEKLVKFRLHESQASFLNNKKDINDKDIYYKLLYTNYFCWLHWRFKVMLFKRYHWSVKLYRYIRYGKK